MVFIANVNLSTVNSAISPKSIVALKFATNARPSLSITRSPVACADILNPSTPSVASPSTNIERLSSVISISATTWKSAIPITFKCILPDSATKREVCVSSIGFASFPVAIL